MADRTYLQVLENSDFYYNGKPSPGLIDTDLIRAQGQSQILSKYGALVDPNGLNASSIFELSGQPCIYFTWLGSSGTARDFHRLHKLAWNHGSAPMLWVITPSEVLLFNSFLKPQPEDESNYERYLLGLFQTTEQGLRKLREFANRSEIESGTFWQRPEMKSLSREQRVDLALLRDLQSTEQLLVQANLDRSLAHSLLGRSIFVTYLEHRQILTDEFMPRKFGVQEFAEALNSKTHTYDIFKWIRTTFNGDLFPLTNENEVVSDEEHSVQDVHLQIVREFLNGTEMDSGYRRFWPYRFEVIPIELISSIFENFVHAQSADLARQQSIHYTPVNLVDLTLSQVFDGLQPNASIGDLSCGSGLFLVEGLRRLVLKRVTEGQALTRHLIRETLYNQIYGVDVNREAIQIAAFSLYLALLELDPNPQPPEELSFQPLINRNLFAEDSFDEDASFNFKEPFATKKLSAIVGNPPWKRSMSLASAIEYCQKRNYPLAKNTPDQALLWRIGDFANEQTRIGLILHAKPFFANTAAAQRAKTSLFRRYRPRLIANLSSLRKDRLFPNSSAPAMVYVAENQETSCDDTFTLVRIAWTAAFNRHGIIELGPDGVQQAPAVRLMEDADWLKIASTGGPRDLALLDRLRDSPNYAKLGELVARFGWQCGRGLGASSTGNHLVADLSLPTDNYLPSGRMPRYRFDVTDLSWPLPKRVRRGHSNPAIYLKPLLICTRGIGRRGFYSSVCESDLVYSEEFVGISAANGNQGLLHYLNAILNSTLATYLLFLMGSVWGIERDKVEQNDLLRIPIPDPDKLNLSVFERVINIENTLNSCLTTQTEHALRAELDNAIFELYGLTDTEQTVVRDFVGLTVDLHMKRGRSQSLKVSGIPELTAYAEELIGVVRPFLITLGETDLKAEIIDAGPSPLRVVKFQWVSASGPPPAISVVKASSLQPVLSAIAKNLPTRLADIVYSRRAVRVYDGDSFFVIKPFQRRYWSRTAGLNDADSILSEHLNRKNGASSQAA